MSTIASHKVLPELDSAAILLLQRDLRHLSDSLTILHRTRCDGRDMLEGVADRLTESLAPLGYELLALAGIKAIVIDPTADKQ